MPDSHSMQEPARPREWAQSAYLRLRAFGIRSNLAALCALNEQAKATRAES